MRYTAQMLKFVLTVCLMAIGAAVPAAKPVMALDPLNPAAVKFQEVATGLDHPILITNAGDGSGRLFIVEQTGYILIFKNGTLLATPFLDIHTDIRYGGEQGLLALAFHPTYNSNGYFYVAYTAPRTGDASGSVLTLKRFSVSGNPDVASAASGSVILTIDHPTNTNHNGGTLTFGPDGYLYWSTGDGGSGGDPPNNSQNLAVLLGKILRLDVDHTDPGLNYSVPSSNPFVEAPDNPSTRGEIWAYGLRNPWRLSFDRDTGDLYIGDVGQNLLEEVDFQPASSIGGENYGWRVMEANTCFNTSNFNVPLGSCSTSGKTLPVTEYDHSGGRCAVTGGYVYRGSAYPALQGYYLYGDYCSGALYALHNEPGTGWVVTTLPDTPYSISSFGEDEQGEVYVADLNGSVYHIRYGLGAVPADFDNNGRSDIVVYRGGAWLKYNFATGAYTGGTWTGAPGGSCIPAPMDYDGDGTVDFTQLCGNAWHFYNHDGSYNKGIWIGLPGAIPVPADYNGDGTDDVVVFDNGAWQFYNFATGLYDAAHSVWTGNPPTWPGGTSRPVPMDYNGDGKADFTIFAGGPWHFYNTNGSYNKGIWTGGVAGDVPVPGNYTGGPADEVVVFRGGAWLFYDFATGAYLPGSSVWTGMPAHWLGGTSLPGPLDYDADGYLNFTVFSGGPWHFYNADGSYNKGIWTGGVAGDQAISRRQLP